MKQVAMQTLVLGLRAVALTAFAASLWLGGVK